MSNTSNTITPSKALAAITKSTDALLSAERSSLSSVVVKYVTWAHDLAAAVRVLDPEREATAATLSKDVAAIVGGERPEDATSAKLFDALDRTRKGGDMQPRKSRACSILAADVNYSAPKDGAARPVDQYLALVDADPAASPSLSSYVAWCNAADWSSLPASGGAGSGESKTAEEAVKAALKAMTRGGAPKVSRVPSLPADIAGLFDGDASVKDMRKDSIEWIEALLLFVARLDSGATVKVRGENVTL